MFSFIFQGTRGGQGNVGKPGPMVRHFKLADMWATANSMILILVSLLKGPMGINGAPGYPGSPGMKVGNDKKIYTST